MPLRNVSGFFRVAFLSLICLVAAFLWPQMPARAEVRIARDTLRVGIAHQMPEVILSFQGRYRLVDVYDGDIIAETSGNETWAIANADGFLVLHRNGVNCGVFKGSIRAEEINSKQSILSGGGALLYKDSLSGLAVLGAGSGVHYINDSGNLRVVDGNGRVESISRGGLNLFSMQKNGQMARYRGNVEVRPGGAGLTVINELSMEHYLYGVVPSEMPTSFPLEALKAQAVASRTFTIAQLGSYGSQGFDMLDNQQYQIYRGYDGEHPQTSQAVDETAGEILVNRGQPISAFFHASSGGYTENSEDVWRDFLGYIRAREDPADFNNKYYHWTVTYSVEQLTRVINEKLKGFSNPGPYPSFFLVTDLKEVQRTNSGQRVKRLLIEGCDAAGNAMQVEINNADRVRAVLGLKSSLFNMQKVIDTNGRLSSVVIKGSGLGHGLGMSQWGASGLALKGYNYQDILQYYYTGVDLVKKY